MRVKPKSFLFLLKMFRACIYMCIFGILTFDVKQNSALSKCLNGYNLAEDGVTLKLRLRPAVVEHGHAWWVSSIVEATRIIVFDTRNRGEMTEGVVKNYVRRPSTECAGVDERVRVRAGGLNDGD